MHYEPNAETETMISVVVLLTADQQLTVFCDNKGGK